MCAQVQRELRAARAEQQRLRDELDSRDSDVQALKLQLDLLRAAPGRASTAHEDDADSWLVAAQFGDEP
jgi:chromosome segregation ATPase